jgi:porin
MLAGPAKLTQVAAILSLLTAADWHIPRAQAQVESVQGESGSKQVDFSAEYVADTLSLLGEGSQEDLFFLDNLSLSLSADLSKYEQLEGVAASLQLILNSGDAPNDVAGTLQGINNIEVVDQQLRLYELWLEKAWSGQSLRVGVYDLNSEFYVTESSGLLLAPAFGIGSELAATGPSGPSIFPLTSLAGRYKKEWQGDGYFQVAIVNAATGIFEQEGRSPLQFEDGVLAIAEAGFGGDVAWAAGVWRYSEQQDRIAVPVANPSDVKAISQGAYALIDLPVGFIELPGDLRFFARGGISDGDTTPFDGGWQTGVFLEDFLKSRPDGVFSFGINQGHLSKAYREAERIAGNVLDREELQFEITYEDKIFPFLTIQPDLLLTTEPAGESSRDALWAATLRLKLAY